MSTKGVAILVTALLLLWCPTMPAVKVAGRGSRGKYRMATRIYDLQHCKDKAHSFVVKNSTSHLEKDGTEYLDTDFELTTTARRMTGLRYIAHRCPIGVGGQCEYYNTRSWMMPVCKLLTSNGMLWSPMVQNVSPPWACPMLKGSYVGRNMTGDVSSLGVLIEGLELDKYSWPFEVQIFSENGLYMCMTFIGEPKRIRVKEN